MQGAWLDLCAPEPNGRKMHIRVHQRRELLIARVTQLAGLGQLGAGPGHKSDAWQRLNQQGRGRCQIAHPMQQVQEQGISGRRSQA